MADIQIAVNAGTQTRLLTAGKYCKDDILVAATAGTGVEDLLVERPSTLKTYRNDRVETVGGMSFYGFSSLQSVYFSKVKTTFSSAFMNCTKLEYAYFPLLEAIELSNTFYGSALRAIELPSIKRIRGTGTFNGSSELVALILPGDTVCTLEASSGFTNTPIASGTGFIYVTDNLLDQYKVATNWSIYKNQIKPKSELPPEIQQWLNEQKEKYDTV